METGPPARIPGTFRGAHEFTNREAPAVVSWSVKSGLRPDEGIEMFRELTTKLPVVLGFVSNMNT
jgi:hypothetical protein